MNMTQRPDGEWRALDKYQIFRHSQQGTNVYREEMQYRVKQLGYDIKTTSAKGEWELAGYDRLHIRAFSQRKEQIEQIISAHGWHPHAANLASVIDRRARGTFDMNYLKQQWKERDLQLGIGLTPTPTYEHDGSPKVGSFEDDDYKYGRSREYGQSRGMGH
jgi:conjugative relaxase-like TrwC/TraI family protein